MTSPSTNDADEVWWDDDVDLICIGSDSVALAAAIAADIAGRQVLIVDPAGVADAETLAGRLGLTEESAEYLDAVTADCGPLLPSGPAAPLTVRATDEPLCPGLSGSATFSGAALRDWATECLASPHGLLTTSAAGPEAATVVLAEFDSGQRLDIAGWLREQAVALRDAVTPRLDALELCQGRVVGAIVSGSAGVSRVRAVDGVVLATRPDGPLPAEASSIAGTAELVLLTQPFSRFARLELRV